MVISHQNRFLFVEVPHTASTAISRELREFYQGELMLGKHSNLSQFLHHASGEEKEYFKFATVRNPLDVMVTNYLKLKNNHRGNYTNPDALAVNGGFVTEPHLRQFRFVQREGIGFPEFLREFYGTVYNNWFLIGASRFDYVLRFENIQEEYDEVLRLIGLERIRALPTVNPTQDKEKLGFSKYYTDDVIDLVVENFGPFMHQWGYDFPEAWNVTSRDVPLKNRLRFGVKHTLANVSAPLIELDPDRETTSKLKRVLDRLL